VEKLDLSASTISRLETAQANVRRGDVRALLDLYEVTSTQRGELLQLAEESRQQPWWEEYKDLPNAAAAGLEAEAAFIRQYAAQVVPGLLQTEAYAREVLQAIRGDDEAHDLERRLKLRMNRQVLLSESTTPQYLVVLDEAVLRRTVGGPLVMHTQLERLVEVSALPQVTLRLLPFGVGAHAGMDGAFTIFSYQRPEEHDAVYQDPDVVFLEDLEGDEYIENPETTRRYNQTFERLLEGALDPDQSIRIVVDIAAQLQ